MQRPGYHNSFPNVPCVCPLSPGEVRQRVRCVRQDLGAGIVLSYRLHSCGGGEATNHSHHMATGMWAVSPLHERTERDWGQKGPRRGFSFKFGGCYGWNCVSRTYVRCTAAWDLVVIHLVPMSSSWARVGPSCVLMKRGNLDPDTHMGRAPCGKRRQI